METNRKRKGFMKGKLVMSIYKATNPGAAYNNNNNNTKVMKPTIKPLPPTMVVQARQKAPHHVEFIVKQDQIAPQPKQKVSFLLPADDGGGIIHDNLYGGVAGDEMVDSKATTYISSVRERLIRLHRINSEHNMKKLQEMHH